MILQRVGDWGRKLVHRRRHTTRWGHRATFIFQAVGARDNKLFIDYDTALRVRLEKMFTQSVVVLVNLKENTKTMAMKKSPHG